MKKINIVHLIAKSTDSQGGVETYIRKLYSTNNNFVEYHGKPRTKKQLNNLKNVEYVKLKGNKHISFNKKVKNIKNEIFIINSEPSLFFLLRKNFLKKNKIFAIDHAHGFKKLSLKANKNKFFYFLFFILKKINKNKFKYIDFITFTNYDVDLLKKLKVNFKSIDYIPTFFDEFDEEIKINKKKYDICYLGRMSSKKRVKFISKIAQKNNLKIITMGGPENKVPKYMRSNNYKGIVTNNKEKYKNLKEAKVFPIISKSEGINFTSIEAMSQKLPLIILDTFPAAKFLIDDNKNGILIKRKKDFELELIKLLNNQEKINELGNNAYDYVLKNFSSSIFLKNWENKLNKKN